MKRSEIVALAEALVGSAKDVRWIRLDPNQIVVSIADRNADGARYVIGDDIAQHEETFPYDPELSAV